jgi:hypothetical protein
VTLRWTATDLTGPCAVRRGQVPVDVTLRRAATELTAVPWATGRRRAAAAWPFGGTTPAILGGRRVPAPSRRLASRRARGGVIPREFGAAPERRRSRR